MFKALRVLIIHPETIDRDKLEQHIWSLGLVPICCETLARAKELMAHEKFSVILSAEFLPDGDYSAVLGAAMRPEGDVSLIVISRLPEWDNYLKALAAGAFDYLVLPPHPAELKRILRAALRDPVRKATVLARAA